MIEGKRASYQFTRALVMLSLYDCSSVHESSRYDDRDHINAYFHGNFQRMREHALNFELDGV
jgi:hypothetical protein